MWIKKRSGGVWYNGEYSHFFLLLPVFQRGKWHFKIKCYRPPLFFMLPQKFSNFSFLTLEFKNRPLATIFFWLESEDQEIKLVWPYNASKKNVWQILIIAKSWGITSTRRKSENFCMYTHTKLIMAKVQISSYWCMWHLLKKNNGVRDIT